MTKCAGRQRPAKLQWALFCIMMFGVWIGEALGGAAKLRWLAPNEHVLTKWRALIKSKAECTLFESEALCVLWDGLTIRLDQVDGFTGEVVRRWDSAAAVAASFGFGACA